MPGSNWRLNSGSMAHMARMRGCDRAREPRNTLVSAYAAPLIMSAPVSTHLVEEIEHRDGVVVELAADPAGREQQGGEHGDQLDREGQRLLLYLRERLE